MAGDPRHACITAADLPLAALLASPGDAALAVLTGTEGPAYRSPGAALVVRDGRVVAGNLSSGCVERDVALQATRCLATGDVRRIRYGVGSPYFDVRLPCGGGLDVAIFPAPAPEPLARARATLAARREARLILTERGLFDADTADGEALLDLRILPDVALHVFGTGPEASRFADLAVASGFATTLASPDPETLAAATGSDLRRRLLRRGDDLADASFDRFSAVVLFFHDHDREPPILAAAAAGEAFYIGAQGGRRTRARRDEELARLGVPPEKIAAMKGPAGLIPGARDPRTLAVSVLSEVVAEAERRRRG